MFFIFQKIDEEVAQSRLQSMHSRISQSYIASRQQATTTPETFTGGALSREGTVFTPLADQEIQAVLARHDNSDSASEAQTEAGHTSRPIKTSESGSEAGYLTDENTESENETRSAASPRLRSAMDSIQEREEEEENLDLAGPKPPKREIVLGEKQTYVEISENTDRVADSQDVVTLKHVSPAASEDSEGDGKLDTSQRLKKKTKSKRQTSKDISASDSTDSDS